MELENKKVLVAGMGRAGLAAAKLLEGRGAKVTITDEKRKEELGEAYKELSGKRIEIKPFTELDKLTRDIELMIVSPGIPSDNPLVERAKEKGIPIMGEFELASSFIKIPIIAVTGTNGKTTTTTLMGKILKKGRRRVVVAGNIGYPLSYCVDKDYELIVAEVSSFQLERIKDFHPFISIILNISPDHLDRYQSLNEYVEAKKRIFMNQRPCDFAIINKDDPVSRTLETRAGKIYFSQEEGPEEGVYLREKSVMASLRGSVREIIRQEEIGIKGPHNLENVLAATAACVILKVKIDNIKAALKEFPGLPHRLELVREIKGVKFINDSKATNVSAVMKALLSFSGPVILIAGGQDKGLDYSLLRPLVTERVKGVILLGEAKEKIAQALKPYQGIKMVENMKEAVDMAFGLATDGDTILLSPASSSYDMFRDFRQRGDVFKKIVGELA
jgi:UDP-N-acetylmuramoylalanine--D-glutamate ligase